MSWSDALSIIQPYRRMPLPSLPARLEHQHRRRYRSIQRFRLSFHGDADQHVRAYSRLRAQPVSFISDEKRGSLPVILLIICPLPVQMGGIDADAQPFQTAGRSRQVLRICKGHPEDRAHGRAYGLRIVNVRAVPAHQDCRRPCRLCGPENGPQVARILNILQNQNVRGLFLLPAVPRTCRQDLFLREHTLAHHRQDSLGCFCVRDIFKYLGRHKHPFRFENGFLPVLFIKFLCHIQLYQTFGRNLPDHAQPFHKKGARLRPHPAFFPKLYDLLHPRIRGAGDDHAIFPPSLFRLTAGPHSLRP